MAEDTDAPTPPANGRTGPDDQANGLAARGRIGTVLPMRRSTWKGTRSIAVTSGKGGVGKSQLTANLAVGLAARGARVLCVDADLGLASLDLMFGVRPSYDLRHLLSGERSAQEILVPGPRGVWLLPACPGRYEMANLPDLEGHALRQALAPVASAFDVVLVDTGAGLGSNAVSFAASGEEVILVVTPDPTSLRDAYTVSKVLEQRHGVTRVDVVVNQVGSYDEGRALFETFDGLCGRFLRLEVGLLGCVPRDPAVRDAVARGEPLLTSPVSSAAAMGLHAVVRRLVARGDVARPSRDGFWAELLRDEGTGGR